MLLSEKNKSKKKTCAVMMFLMEEKDGRNVRTRVSAHLCKKKHKKDKPQTNETGTHTGGGRGGRWGSGSRNGVGGSPVHLYVGGSTKRHKLKLDQK